MLLEAQFGPDITPIETPRVESHGSLPSHPKQAHSSSDPKHETDQSEIKQESSSTVSDDGTDDEKAHAHAVAAELARLHAAGLYVPGVEIRAERYVARVWLETLESSVRRRYLDSVSRRWWRERRRWWRRYGGLGEARGKRERDSRDDRRKWSMALPAMKVMSKHGELAAWEVIISMLPCQGQTLPPSMPYLGDRDYRTTMLCLCRTGLHLCTSSVLIILQLGQYPFLDSGPPEPPQSRAILLGLSDEGACRLPSPVR